MHPSSTATVAPARRAVSIHDPEYRRGQRPANADRKFPAEPMDPEDVLALLNQCPMHGRHRKTGIRHRALITVMWRAGLRIEEALELEPHHVNLRRGTVSVMRGKGMKQRAIPLDRAACVLVEEWLEVRRELPFDRDSAPPFAGPEWGPLFCVVNRPNVGRKMNSALFRDTLALLKQQTGIHRRIHAHALRHTFASEVYFVEGAAQADVQVALGHNHASTTDRYLHRIVGTKRLHHLLIDRPWPGHELAS